MSTEVRPDYLCVCVCITYFCCNCQKCRCIFFRVDLLRLQRPANHSYIRADCTLGHGIRGKKSFLYFFSSSLSSSKPLPFLRLLICLSPGGCSTTLSCLAVLYIKHKERGQLKPTHSTWLMHIFIGRPPFWTGSGLGPGFFERGEQGGCRGH